MLSNAWDPKIRETGCFMRHVTWLRRSAVRSRFSEAGGVFYDDAWACSVPKAAERCLGRRGAARLVHPEDGIVTVNLGTQLLKEQRAGVAHDRARAELTFRRLWERRNREASTGCARRPRHHQTRHRAGANCSCTPV